MPETVDPRDDGVRAVPERSDVPVRRHDPRSVEHVPAARRRRVGRQRRRQVGAARQRRHLLRAPEHAQPGRLGHDQRPAAADDLRQHRRSAVVRRARRRRGRACSRRRRCRRAVPAVHRRARLPLATTRTRASTRSTSATSRSWRPTWPATSTSPWAEGRQPDALPQLQPQRRRSCCDGGPAPATPTSTRGTPFGPQLGEVMVTTSLRRVALSRPDARRAQALLEAATSSKRTTCSRRTRTTTRTSAIRSPIAASTSTISTLDYGPSDRDIRHKFNFFGYFELPGGFQLNARVQARRRAADHAEPARA